MCVCVGGDGRIKKDGQKLNTRASARASTDVRTPTPAAQPTRAWSFQPPELVEWLVSLSASSATAEVAAYRRWRHTDRHTDTKMFPLLPRKFRIFSRSNYGEDSELGGIVLFILTDQFVGCLIRGNVRNIRI